MNWFWWKIYSHKISILTKFLPYESSTHDLIYLYILVSLDNAMSMICRTNRRCRSVKRWTCNHKACCQSKTNKQNLKLIGNPCIKVTFISACVSVNCVPEMDSFNFWGRLRSINQWHLNTKCVNAMSYIILFFTNIQLVKCLN